MLSIVIYFHFTSVNHAPQVKHAITFKKNCLSQNIDVSLYYHNTTLHQFFPPPLMLIETCDLLREWPHGKPDTLTPADKLVISIWGRSSVTCSRVKLIWGRRFLTDDEAGVFVQKQALGYITAVGIKRPARVSASYLIFAFICLDSHVWSLILRLHLLCLYPGYHI